MVEKSNRQQGEQDGGYRSLLALIALTATVAFISSRPDQEISPSPLAGRNDNKAPVTNFADTKTLQTISNGEIQPD